MTGIDGRSVSQPIGSTAPAAHRLGCRGLRDVLVSLRAAHLLEPPAVAGAFVSVERGKQGGAQVGDALRELLVAGDQARGYIPRVGFAPQASRDSRRARWSRGIGVAKSDADGAVELEPTRCRQAVFRCATTQGWSVPASGLPCATG